MIILLNCFFINLFLILALYIIRFLSCLIVECICIRNGQVVGAIQVTDEDEMMLISDKGTLVRARAADVSIIGRNTQGVTLINIADDEALVSVAKIAETDDDENDTEEAVLSSEE